MATVKDILHTDLRMIGTHETLERAARVFAGEVLGLLIVVENDRLAGVLSERDIVRSLGEGDDPGQTHVFDVMTEEVVTIDIDSPIGVAVGRMLDSEIRHLVVTEGGSPYGIVSTRDLLRAQLSSA
jgi:predicted transcriptional regulator